MKELFRLSDEDVGLRFTIAENESGDLLFTDHVKMAVVGLPRAAQQVLFHLLAGRVSPRAPGSSDAPASPPFVSSEVETPEHPERSRGSEVETPQRPQCATDPFMVMKTAIMDASPALAAIAPMEDIDKLAEAACAAYGRHQTGEAYGLPPYEPPTCGTGHLVAERTLRLLGRGTPFDALPDGDAIMQLATLVEQAGVAFAREALARDTKPFLLDEDIPF